MPNNVPENRTDLLGGKRHQIVHELLERLVPDAEEGWVFEAGTFEDLAAGLAGMRPEDRSLAVRDLIRFANHVEHTHQMVSAAAGIHKVTSPYSRRMRTSGEASLNAASERQSAAGKKFNQFSGAGDRMAPKVGEEAPSGAKKIGSWGFIPRKV